MKGTKPMQISFFKYVYYSRFYGRELERREVFTNMDDAILSFKECFKHHLGRKPTRKQVDTMKSMLLVTAKSGQLEYEFSFCLVK